MRNDGSVVVARVEVAQFHVDTGLRDAARAQDGFGELSAVGAGRPLKRFETFPALGVGESFYGHIVRVRHFMKRPENDVQALERLLARNGAASPASTEQRVFQHDEDRNSTR